jgi:hypothetical protein
MGGFVSALISFGVLALAFAAGMWIYSRFGGAKAA